MHIAIIGSGYIGLAVAYALTARGDTVTVTTTTPEKIPALTKTFDSAKVAVGQDRRAIAEAVAGADGIIVCVAPGRGGDYAGCYLETAHSVVAALSANPEVPVLYTGSTSVYGPGDGSVVTETTPVAPVTDGQRILCETEATYLDNLKAVCVLRLGEIYGPGRDIGERLQAMAGKALPGKGDSITNLVHRDDVVGALLFLLDHKLTGLYNVCGETHLERKTFYERICQEKGIAPPRWDPSAVSAHGGRRIVDNSKLKACGFRFQHPSAIGEK